MKIGPQPVKLIHKRDPRHLVSVGLVPDGFRLRFYASDPAQHRDYAVENAQAPFYLDRKVHVSGRVDKVDFVPFPEESRARGGYRYASLLLLGQVVHRRRPFVNLPNLMDLFGVKEDPLSKGGLPRVDVSCNADIADSRYIVGHGHSGDIL
jgi:hypothetical protein